MNWKKISSELVTQHSDEESAVISLDPHSVGEIVNLSDDSFCLEVKGKELKSKKVRKFLWDNRKKRALQRKNAVLWSAYLEDEDISYVGVGALTTKRVADRMSKRHG
mgnify:CR=1 FL=1|jgi:hypothetical protein